MKLLFGTGNQAKLNVMKIRLKPLGINLIVEAMVTGTLAFKVSLLV